MSRPSPLPSPLLLCPSSLSSGTVCFLLPLYKHPECFQQVFYTICNPQSTFKSYTVLSPASWSPADMHSVLPLNREKLGPWHPLIIPSTKVLIRFPQDPTQLPAAPNTHLLTTQALHTSQILLFWLTTFFHSGQRSS